MVASDDDDDPASAVHFTDVFLADLEATQIKHHPLMVENCDCILKKYIYIRWLPQHTRSEVWQVLRAKSYSGNSNQMTMISTCQKNHPQKKIQMHELSPRSEDEPVMALPLQKMFLND